MCKQPVASSNSLCDFVPSSNLSLFTPGILEARNIQMRDSRNSNNDLLLRKHSSTAGKHKTSCSTAASFFSCHFVGKSLWSLLVPSFAQSNQVVSPTSPGILQCLVEWFAHVSLSHTNRGKHCVRWFFTDMGLRKNLWFSNNHQQTTNKSQFVSKLRK